MCVCVCVCVYVREREREKKGEVIERTWSESWNGSLSILQESVEFSVFRFFALLFFFFKYFFLHELL